MIVVTGASGHLGRLVVEGLLQKVQPGEIIATARSPERIADLAARGVKVRHADYARPETLAAAFDGAQVLLLVSSSEVGQRARQHAAVIDAAKREGVRLLVYTSVLRAGTSKLGLAAEHAATEDRIRVSGLPYTFLRNGWYTENYTEHLGPALARGVIAGCAGTGRVAAATRADYAAAAVEVLTSGGHARKVYELAGDLPFTMAELAAEVSRQSGKPVVYQDMPKAQYKALLLGAGLPEAVAELYADSDAGLAQGELDDATGDLRALLRRPTTPLADAVKAALQR
jgi:NAD(P)H dehydrogenase (quinone)